MSRSPSSHQFKYAQRILSRGQNVKPPHVPVMKQEQLYPLDVPIEFPDNLQDFILNEQILKTPQSFFETNKTARNQIVQYLIGMIEKIASISFHLLVEDKITEKEAKNYAAKNILQNTKLFCERISKKILDNYQTYISKSCSFSRQFSDYDNK